MADLVASEMNANDIQNVYVKSGVTRGNCTAVQVYFSGNCIDWLVASAYLHTAYCFPCKSNNCTFHSCVYSIAERKLQTRAGQFSTCFAPQNKKQNVAKAENYAHFTFRYRCDADENLV